MATYLYGLTLADRPSHIPADARGVAGAGVRALPCGDLSAIVSTIERAAVRPTLDAVRAHDGALQRIVDGGATVAAVRFGQTFDDDAGCRQHVTERADRIVHLLREHDGAVEMRVLVPSSEDAMTVPPSGAGPGRAYLESLRASGSLAPPAGLGDALGPLVRAERVERLPQSRGVAVVHLVKRADLGAYRSALASMPSLVASRVIGPLALYSFAEPAE